MACKELNRRTYAASILKSSAALALPWPRITPAESSSLLRLELTGESPGEVPKDFIGLGYEMLSVATPGLLSTSNHRYLELVRGLGRNGVIRMGGIVADYTRYLRDGTAMDDCKNTVITHRRLEEFSAFLEVTGWSAIWSVNFAQGTIDQAVDEARAVSEVLGANLLAIELGNEVENYGRSQPFRPNPYTYEAYRREFDEWHAAIIAAVPGIRFAGPDTAQSLEWVERIAEDAGGKIQPLTTHYYRNGQRHGSEEQLLAPDPRLEEVLVRLRAASRQSTIPWRMCEINSFSGGGLLGVSDTFIGTLWTLDTMLRLAQHGCSGLNLETGGNQLGFVSSYSPIQDDGHGVNSAGAPYYGMLAFVRASAGCHQMFLLKSGPLGEGISAFAFGADGKPRSVVIVNRSKASVHVPVGDLGIKQASVLRLTAPFAHSKTGVRFGDAFVDADGRWKSKSREKLHDACILVPAMNAVVLR